MEKSTQASLKIDKLNIVLREEISEAKKETATRVDLLTSFCEEQIGEVNETVRRNRSDLM